ncbi:MAG: hypothetical protein AAFY65_13645 [Pseudomonadota bacterium]
MAQRDKHADGMWKARAIGVSALLLSVSIGPSLAQQKMDVGKHFDVFNQFCPAAMAGEAALREVLPGPGPFGEKVWSASPDETWVTYQSGIDDVLIIGSFRRGTALEMRECMVQQITSDAPSVDDLEAAFLERVPKGDGISISGGKVEEQIPPVGAFASTPPDFRNDRREYMVEGALPVPNAIFVGSMGQGNFRIFSFVQVLAE